MFKRKKIPCYVVVFDELSVIKPSIEFLVKYNDRIEIVVIENTSGNTPNISAYINKLGKEGKLDRYYRFHNNIAGRAFDEVLSEEKKLINRSPYVILTDGDLSSDDTNWLDEEISVLKNNSDVFVCATDLDLSNLPTENFPIAQEWVPEPSLITSDYLEGVTGIHLLSFRGKELCDFLDWKQNNSTDRFHDSLLHNYCYSVLGKKWARTKNAKAYHHTWDLYKDLSHPYTKFKTSDIVNSIRQNSMSLDASYTLIDFTKNS